VKCLRRAPLPPSWHPIHGYFWCGLTPMRFTDMHGWPADITPDTFTDTEPDAAAGAAARAETKIALERTILATWLLMGQTIVRSETMMAPRAARHRIARADPTLDAAVRYIDLRRARTEPSDNPEENRPGTRAYRHRWVVRGHWRNQWYPSRNDHRPIWISQYIAGPDGKPLLGGERVNVLRR
jgi:hypothetical protein